MTSKKHEEKNKNLVIDGRAVKIVVGTQETLGVRSATASLPACSAASRSRRCHKRMRLSNEAWDAQQFEPSCPRREHDSNDGRPHDRDQDLSRKIKVAADRDGCDN